MRVGCLLEMLPVFLDLFLYLGRILFELLHKVDVVGHLLPGQVAGDDRDLGVKDLVPAPVVGVGMADHHVGCGASCQFLGSSFQI
jgi:hypothetical protein